MKKVDAIVYVGIILMLVVFAWILGSYRIEQHGFARGDLMSLEEYEQTRPKYEIITETHNGIACPKCGQELWDDLTTIIATYPAQYPISCKNKDCGWTGTRH